MTSAPLVHIRGDSTVRIWGLTAADRLRRQLRSHKAVEQVALERLGPDECIVLLRGDHVYDESVIRALVSTPDVVLVSGDAGGDGAVPVAVHARAAQARLDAEVLSPSRGLRVVTPVELAGRYNPELRSVNEPYAEPLTAASRPALERRMFHSTYKGATDFVTKYAWPWPARVVTDLCARAGVTPNQVTFLSLILCLLATWLFWKGLFWPGVIAAWAMTFLDTVDGKLARLTITSSRWGNIFDHGIDLVHPPFWYWAWWAGLDAAGYALPSQEALDAALIIILVGYAAGRAIEGAFLHVFGMHIHVWRPVDFVMRHITARRNPNLFLMMLGLAINAPDLGLIAVAVWTVVCTVFHLVRLLQALSWRRAGWPVESYLSALNAGR